ncbi:MAG: cysteine desulfurase family protein [Thermodesulfovibrionales bacterium]
MIYLDNNATTPVDPEVSDAVFASLRRDIGNPSSSHLPGRRVKEAIEQNRLRVAGLIGCSPAEIFFTSGGTESNNLALIGTALAATKGHILISAIEHPSVSQACSYLEGLGFMVSEAPVDADGLVRTADLVKALRKDTILVSVMHSNNETGAIQPVEEIGRICRERGIIFHTDAAQTIGKAPFSVGSSTDLATIVSHKFYGPKGIGALYIRQGVRLRPILHGAGHEQGMRPGTENVAGIAGIGKAGEIAVRDMKLRVSHTGGLRDLLYAGLKAALPDITVNAEKAARLPNTLSLRVPGIRAQELVELLKDQVAFSAGSACHAGACSPSGVLKKMGLSDDEALSSVRLSVGKDNTAEEITAATDLIVRGVQTLRKSASSA